MNRHQSRVIGTLRFEWRSFVRSTIASTAFSNFNSAPPFVTPTIKSQYSALKAHTQKHHDNDLILLNRILYLDNYQAFEAFISDCLVAFFYLFPRFISDNQDGIPNATIALADLVECKSLIALKKLTAERKARTLIQSTSLMELLQKFSKRFGFEFSLSKSELHDLVHCVATRNILIHNDGLVNDAYKNLMRKYSLELRFQPDQRIEISDEYLKDSRRAQLNLAERLTDCISQNAKQVVAYHSSR